MNDDADRTLNDALRALAAESSARRAPERVEAALLTEFRRRRARRQTRWAGFAAAAALLLAVSLATLRPGRQPVAPPPQAAGRRVYTEFIPVVYGEPFHPEDGGRIVRVHMPRTTLASFGLPVNQDRLDERIQADVLLGEDNLVRAVRFEQ
jgi:hypothetical protein